MNGELIHSMPYVVLLGVTAATTVGLAVYAWRYRSEPGAGPFAWLMVAVSIWGVCSAGTLLFGPDAAGVHQFLERLQFFGIAFVPVPWLLFTLAYTGYDEFVSARVTAVLSVVPVVTVVLVWTNPAEVFWTYSEVVLRDGIAVEVHEYGPWFWVNLVYSYTLIGVGTFLVLRLVVVSDYLFADQSALLVVGSVIPVVGNAASVMGAVPIQGLDLTPFTFAVTGVAFGYALFRHRLFDLVPATRRLGRDAAIADLEDGVVILDDEDRVVYCNDAAATVLGCTPREALGESVGSFLDESAVDFDAPDALGEIDDGDRVYEVRNSPITDRDDRTVGSTLVFGDVTARKRQAQRLRQQRDELRRLERINELIRGVNRALVGASSREDVERTVCDRLADGELYEGAWIADGTTDDVVGKYATDGGSEDAVGLGPVTWRDHQDGPPDRLEGLPDVDGPGYPEGGDWTLVPLTFGHTVYGGLVLATGRDDAFDDRELGVLDELGRTIGHSINAVESRRTLLAEVVTKLEFGAPDAPVGNVAADAAVDLRLEGMTPRSEDELLVYLRVEGDPEAALEAAAALPEIGGPRLVEAGETGGLLECTLHGGSPLVALSEQGIEFRSATADGTEYRIVVETVPDADVRAILERVQAVCPNVDLLAKHERNRSTVVDGMDPASLGELTDRQHEALEAAYRSGYFDWPRASTAEEVADEMDIASATLHSHLRKAEGKLVAELFGDPGDGTDRGD